MAWMSRCTTRAVTITELTLYSTSACHLCELAAELVRPWLALGWRMETVDIAGDEELWRRYRLTIPVLKLSAGDGSGPELAWPFDAGQLRGFLTGAAPEFNCPP